MNLIYDFINNAEIKIRYSEHEFSMQLTIPLVSREEYSRNIPEENQSPKKKPRKRIT